LKESYEKNKGEIKHKGEEKERMRLERPGGKSRFDYESSAKRNRAVRGTWGRGGHRVKGA